MTAKPPAGRGPLPTWDPLHELLVLKERMNRLFENVMSRGGDLAAGDPAGWSPAVDLREDAEGFHLSAEIPGVPRNSLSLRVEGQTLSFEGDRPLDRHGKATEHLRVERFYGPFSRQFHLPMAIDEGRVTARFEHGVLEVFLPKSTRERSGSVRIPIA
jgi:HSP20 family protein